MAVDSDWISRYRGQVTAFLNALEDLLALKQQYTALDYGNTLTDEDLAGANSDLTLPDIPAAVSSVDAIATLVGQGHNTNLYTLKL